VRSFDGSRRRRRELAEDTVEFALEVLENRELSSSCGNSGRHLLNNEIGSID